MCFMNINGIKVYLPFSIVASTELMFVLWLEQEGNMPLEDLLAFYGYEPTIPAVANSSANSSPSELADELPDMTLDKVSTSMQKKNPRSVTIDCSYQFL